MNIAGIPVVESNLLPVEPSPGEVGRRIVRHGMADVLRWLGEDIGPRPDDKIDALLIDGRLVMSARAARGLVAMRGLEVA